MTMGLRLGGLFMWLGAVAIAIAGCSSSSPGTKGRPPGAGGAGNSGGAGNGAGTLGFAGGIVINTAACGDHQLNSGESCDDGNTAAGDGCSAACQIEADCTCDETKTSCTCMVVCGDGALASSETCDDHNATSGDGCSADCKTVEPGWVCRVPGRTCVPLCGDGVITGTEKCDDGNANSGDGCSSTCLVEPGYACDPVNTPCVKSICGNGKKESGESCDFGDLTASPATGPNGLFNGLFLGDGSGCSKTCTQEPTCRSAAGVTQACTPRCGDANVDPGEECDDGNQVDADGCSAMCKIEATAGFTCETVSKPDTQPCKSGAGQCLQLPITYRDFNGSNQTTATPKGHPDFFFYGANGPDGSKAICIPNASGSNLLTQPVNGTCPPVDATKPCSGLAAATLDTDGKPKLGASNKCACIFTDWDGTGILSGATGVSTCTSGAASPQVVGWANGVAAPLQVAVIKDNASFKQWYADSTFSIKSVSTLELPLLAGTTNQYQFSSGTTVYDDIYGIRVNGTGTLSSGFFPLEASAGVKMCNLWPYWATGLTAATCVANATNPIKQQWDPRFTTNSDNGGPVTPVTGVARNFYFTSEIRYLFRYAGGETLTFFGDDDVWVYINGHLALDLGAPHERLQGTVTLQAGGNTAISSLAVWNNQTNVAVPIPGYTAITSTGFGLTVGSTYELAIFHADQHPRESNYQLTVSGYATTTSECVPTCGDGKVATGEECDDGNGGTPPTGGPCVGLAGACNDDAIYGGCTTACKLGPFCGDMIVNGPEQCDLGPKGNTATYGAGGCTAGCMNAHFCGDGIVDSAFGEQCDAGASNADGNVCNSKCQITPK